MKRIFCITLLALALLLPAGTCGVADDDARELPPVLTAALAGDSGIIAGTDDGWLLRCDLVGRRLTATELPRGGAVRDLAAGRGRVFALTDFGLLTVPDGGPPAWLLGPWPDEPDEEQQRLAEAGHCRMVDDEIILHSFHDIYRCDPATGRVERLIRSADNISAVAVQAGTVWFGTLRGLYHWSPGMTEAEAVSPSQFGLLTPLAVTTMATLDGLTMAGTLGAGLLVRAADGEWRIDGTEPEIYRIYPAGPGRALLLLPPARWRYWSVDGAWGDTVVLPFGPETRVIERAASLTVFEPGGSGVQRLGAGGWEQYYAGRRQLFYRGAVRPPAAAGPQSVVPLLSRKWLLLILPAGALLGLAWWYFRRRRLAGHEHKFAPAPAATSSPAWQETPPALPTLIPVSVHREQLRPVGQGLELLAAEQRQLEQQLAALPAEQQDGEQEPVIRQLRELKQKVDERHARAREIAERLRREIAGLEHELQVVRADRERLDRDHHERKLDRSETREWRSRLLLRQAGAERERAARLALIEKFADVLPE